MDDEEVELQEPIWSSGIVTPLTSAGKSRNNLWADVGSLYQKTRLDLVAQSPLF
jgi:hypothetical protein